MNTWRRWAYLHALLRVGGRTAGALLSAGWWLATAALLWVLQIGDVSTVVVWAGSGAWLAWRLMRDYFGGRPGGLGLVWEWPSDMVRREEQERRDARKGIELIASVPPEGSGTEMESGTAPEGRGTELTAGEEVSGRPPMPRERA